MRRAFGIWGSSEVWGFSARSAVAAALPLAGVLYLAAEDKRLIVNTADGPQVITLHSTKSDNTKSGETGQDPVVEAFHTASDRDPRIAESRPITVPTASAPVAKVERQSQFELEVEQQTAHIPVQYLPNKAAKDTHTRQIVISIPDRRLALMEDGRLVTVYPVAVGKAETPSPQGEFTVINHAVNPTYRHDGKEVGPGKSNPLGTRWMGLSAKGYGIHGTNVQSSVGTVASHGCFRMKKKDVEELYRRVQVGDAIFIRGERDELTASLFGTDTNGKMETEVAQANTMGAAASDQ